MAGNVDPFGILSGPVNPIPVCGFCRGAGEVAVGRNHDGAEILHRCRRCNGTGAPADTERGAA